MIPSLFHRPKSVPNQFWDRSKEKVPSSVPKNPVRGFGTKDLGRNVGMAKVAEMVQWGVSG